MKKNQILCVSADCICAVACFYLSMSQWNRSDRAINLTSVIYFNQTVYAFEFILGWDKIVKGSSFLTYRLTETCDSPDAYKLSSTEEVLFSSKFYLRVQVYRWALCEETQVYLSDQ